MRIRRSGFIERRRYEGSPTAARAMFQYLKKSHEFMGWGHEDDSHTRNGVGCVSASGVPLRLPELWNRRTRFLFLAWPPGKDRRGRRQNQESWVDRIVQSTI